MLICDILLNRVFLSLQIVFVSSLTQGRWTEISAKAFLCHR